MKKNIKLYEIVDSMMNVYVEEFGLVEVENYDELYDKIKKVMESRMDEEDDYSWIDSMYDFLGFVDNENDLKREIIEGDFNNDVFNIIVGEEVNILCIRDNVEVNNEEDVKRIYDEFIGNV